MRLSNHRNTDGEAYYREACEHGWEGLIAKRADAPCRSGRSLRYAGKVGTGYDNRTLNALHDRMARLSRPKSPFADPVRERAAHWISPELVVQVGFTEWTTDGRLRHPRYTGVREDKAAADVIRETR